MGESGMPSPEPERLTTAGAGGAVSRLVLIQSPVSTAATTINTAAVSTSRRGRVAVVGGRAVMVWDMTRLLQ